MEENNLCKEPGVRAPPGRGNGNYKRLEPLKNKGCLRDSKSSTSTASELDTTQTAACARRRTQNPTARSEVSGRSEDGNDLRCCLKGSARSYKKSGSCRSKSRSEKTCAEHLGEEGEAKGGIPDGRCPGTTLGWHEKKAGEKTRRSAGETGGSSFPPERCKWCTICPDEAYSSMRTQA